MENPFVVYDKGIALIIWKAISDSQKWRIDVNMDIESYFLFKLNAPAYGLFNCFRLYTYNKST